MFVHSSDSTAGENVVPYFTNRWSNKAEFGMYVVNESRR